MQPQCNDIKVIQDIQTASFNTIIINFLPGKIWQNIRYRHTGGNYDK